jgi:hypothetical protein
LLQWSSTSFILLARGISWGSAGIPERQGGGIMKKAWSKPTLITLFRGRPEEAVLLACKTENDGVLGPEGTGARDCDVQEFEDCQYVGAT